MLGEVDCLAHREPRLHVLGEHRERGKATDELAAGLGQLGNATGVGREGSDQVLVTAGDGAAAVDAREQGMPVGDPAAGLGACADPNLFARWFRDRDTWRAWFVFLRAPFGLPMTADDLALYKECTGRDEPPAGGAKEAWLVVGAAVASRWCSR